MQNACLDRGQKLVDVLADRLAQEQDDTLDETLVEVRFCTLD